MGRNVESRAPSDSDAGSFSGGQNDTQPPIREVVTTASILTPRSPNPILDIVFTAKAIRSKVAQAREIGRKIDNVLEGPKEK